MKNDKVMQHEEKNDLLISIVVPVYNIAPYLPQCIQSICDQTYTNLEIILVNDASTDSSGEICNSYAKRDKRIRVIHKQVNEGLVAARKTGIKNAKGDLLGHIDGDDWIESTMFQVMVEQYQKDESDIVQIGFIEDGGKCKAHPYKKFNKNVEVGRESELVEKWMTEREMLIGSQIFTKLYRRKLFETCYEQVPDDMSNGEDFVFFVLLMKMVKKVSSIDQCLYHYRVREDSLSHRKNGIELLLKEDKLTAYLTTVITDLYPSIENHIIEDWVLKRKLSQLRSALKQYNFDLPYYRYRDIGKLFDKRVVIYGAGEVGRDYLMQLSEYEQIQIVNWVDKNAVHYKYSFRQVNSVDSIKDISFDYIVIAVQNEIVATQIENELISKFDIKKEMILWNNLSAFSVL